MARFYFPQVCKPKISLSSKNASFESNSHYEDINVTSKEYAGISGDSVSDGARRIRYPKVLPDFPGGASSAERRLSLPPPLAGIPEGTKIPPPPPPRISSTLGRKKDQGKSETMTVMQFNKTQPDTIPEEHKSPVVPCVPNKVCPPVKKPVEPRIVIKASLQPQTHQQKQLKRTNIPRVVHPQNNDKTGKANGGGGESDTGTVKRKKK